MKAVVLALVAGCASPLYLGAKVPQPCTSGDAEGCVGWIVERDLAAAQLDVYDDPYLQTYVQSIADRLAKGSQLARPPHVVITDHDGTYATSGGRVVIARSTIQRLGSEAELAGVIAHEMVHLEGHHSFVSLYGPHQDEAWLAARRDAEAIADERAVSLLEKAGYAPAAMARALREVLVAQDDEHPDRDERVARAVLLANHRTVGFEGRAELLAHVSHMVVGTDTRLGRRVGTSWVVAALGLTLDLPPDATFHSDDEILVLRHEDSTLTGYAIGVPWARELAASLEDRAVQANPLGSLIFGTVPLHGTKDDSPLGKLVHAIHSTLPQPLPGTHVAILLRPHGALVLELGGHDTSSLHLREATAKELAAVEPPRIVVEHATTTGAVAKLGVCGDRLLDDPHLLVRPGDAVKCVDRVAVETRRAE